MCLLYTEGDVSSSLTPGTKVIAGIQVIGQSHKLGLEVSDTSPASKLKYCHQVNTV